MLRNWRDKLFILAVVAIFGVGLALGTTIWAQEGDYVRPRVEYHPARFEVVPEAHRGLLIVLVTPPIVACDVGDTIQLGAIAEYMNGSVREIPVEQLDFVVVPPTGMVSVDPVTAMATCLRGGNVDVAVSFRTGE
jgi:hypothetical protein